MKLSKVLIQMHMILENHKEIHLFCHRNNLDYILMSDCIMPPPKLVQAILVLTPPQNFKQLHRFLDMVQYYRDLRAR